MTSRRMLPDGPARRFARSGWLPAVLLYALTAYLVREHAHVAGRDILAFTAYAATCLTLPGTLIWRAVQGRGARPLLEDLVIGTMVGFVVELPAYLVGRAAGFPYSAALAAALIAAVSLCTRSGRRLWRSGGTETQTPGGVSWALAGVVAYAVVWLARNVWAASPVSGVALRTPYVDEPFHLALTGELRHHVPPQMPFVDGVPLFYHWFTYVHLASASWISGLEPIVLLRGVGILLMVVVTVLGVAVVSNRLSGRTWPGVAAAALLVVVPTVDVFAWTPGTASWSGSLFLAALLYLSPTQTFGTMLSVLALLLVWELLEPERRDLSLGRWVLTVATLAALAGAKSTFPPIFLAGLLTVVVAKLVLERRLDRQAAILTGVSVVVMLGARVLLYGSGTRSLTWAPFASSAPLAHAMGLTDASKPVLPVVAGVVLLSYLGSRLAAFAGAVGMLSDGGWRSGPTQFVFAAVGASVAATFALDHPGLSQFYFILSASGLIVVASAVGLARLFPGEGSTADPRAAYHVGAALLAGVAVALLATSLSSRVAPVSSGASGLSALGSVLVPQAAVVVLLAGAGFLLALLSRRRRWLEGSSALLVTCMVFGLGLPGTAAVVAHMVSDPWPTPTSHTEAPAIGKGGIAAAQWLRAHSSAGDLVATNAHCRWGSGSAPDCDHRNFWISGYTQRRVLVEGWAYIAPETVGVPSTELSNSVNAPFWDSERLRDNDRAFTVPSAEDLDRLRRHYGVDWLFVDLRYRTSPEALGAHAQLRYARGVYRVYELR